jgi:CheY-like chemotaxis protein
MPKILIVEDQADNVEIFTRLLKRAGFECVVAGHKQAALELAREARPDLILMDIRMPLVEGGEESQVAGLEAARELKADPATAAIPVIALTGDAMRDFRSRLEEAGFSGYLEKPVTDFMALVTLIRKHLAGAPEP